MATADKANDSEGGGGGANYPQQEEKKIKTRDVASLTFASCGKGGNGNWES